jgi:hypothetical protein
MPRKDRKTARNLLYDLQDTCRLISDPHLTPLGLRFPFLIAEAKTGGNLYQARNQAAVGGSTAVRIFESLSDLCCAQNPDREYEETDLILPLAFLSPLRGRFTNYGFIFGHMVKKTSTWRAYWSGELLWKTPVSTSCAISQQY